jgi:hypothetical protein
MGYKFLEVSTGTPVTENLTLVSVWMILEPDEIKALGY